MRILLLPTVLFGSLGALAAAEQRNGFELVDAVYAYEPTYFALDPGASDAPINAKFQFSLALRVLGKGGEGHGPRPDGLYAAFSQTSFWDLQSESKPFYDSSYRPEAWWHADLPFGGLALEPGFGHESNGRGGADSRSINHLFLRALGSWDVDGVTVTASPRVRAYVEKEDNPDIQRYRGYVDLVGSARRVGSWGVAATGRIGSGMDRGSLQLELSHPVEAWTSGWAHGFLYVQGFAGWSETLLDYDAKSPQPRLLFGFALVR